MDIGTVVVGLGWSGIMHARTGSWGQWLWGSDVVMGVVELVKTALLCIVAGS